MTDQGQARPAGWKKDPTGRHFGRYWDGEQWTENVISAEKVQSLDPMPEPALFDEAPPAPPSRPAAQPIYREPTPMAPTYAPQTEGKRRKDGGVKVWKIALGVMLGLFATMAVCAAIIGGAANEVSEDLESKPAVVRVEAAPSVCWSGSIGEATRDGCGAASYDVETIFGDVVSANVQKKDAGAGELTIIIELDGREVARNSTTAAYGLASVTSS
jgi:hypothetical protein